MDDTTIPGDVRRFLLATIPSVPHLEALLLLRERPTDWTASDLAGRLYIDPAAASALVEYLSGVGLVACAGPACRYAPSDPTIASTIDVLAALYGRQTVAIARLIHSISDRKAQNFADAFLLRKER